MNIVYIILISLAIILFLGGFIIGIIEKKRSIRWEDFTKVINIRELTEEYRNEVTTEMAKIVEEKKEVVEDFSVPVILQSTLLEESLELYDDEIL